MADLYPTDKIWIVAAISFKCNYMTMAAYSERPDKAKIKRAKHICGDESCEVYVKELWVDEVAIPFEV